MKTDIECYERGIEKGKLEQKKEELEFHKDMIEDKVLEKEALYFWIEERIKQLQKEIGGNSK